MYQSVVLIFNTINIYLGIVIVLFLKNFEKYQKIPIAIELHELKFVLKLRKI